MKKTITLLLALTLLLSTAACGGKAEEESPEPEETPVVEEIVPEETPEPEPEPEPEETPEPTPEPTEEPEPEPEEIDLSNVRGGTNQNDAVLFPMNTKIYGTVSDGVGRWYAFTTGDDPSAVYYVTGVNKTTASEYLTIYLYDDFGEKLGFARSGSGGAAATITADQLLPNTTYYVRALETNNNDYIYKDTVDYMIIIRDPSDQPEAYGTTGNLTEAKGAADALEGKIRPGTNQDDAAFLASGTAVSGTLSDGIGHWYAFTTGRNPDTVYQITGINKTTASEYLSIYLYDELGKKLDTVRSGNGGVAATITADQLLPNTTYYVRALETNNNDYIYKDTVDYTIRVQASETETSDPMATIERVEEALVFETPFELTETQVMFAAESAKFVDEAAAKQALKPVAEVILAHPGHNILLAGTTATDGSQAARVTLSNNRAQAVKDLLVKTYGVPESQLLTIGLGFEADPFVRGKDRDANGKFIETEGAKNRRVVVLDANDPIALELLGR